MATTTVKKVKIQLPLTRTEKDDVYVCVNGESYQIKRGVHTVAALGVHHSFIGLLLGTVDGTDIHFLIGLFIVGSIAQSAVQILVQVLAVGGFVRVLRIVDGIL